MTNPIKGSDIDIRVKLTSDGTPITSNVTFEIIYYDSYNHGKVWKYIPTIVTPPAPLGGDTWVVRFPADKQRFSGYHNLRCIVDLSGEGNDIQQVIFKRAFHLADPLVYEDEVPILGPVEVESTDYTISGEVSIGQIVESVEYNPQTMIITIHFVGGTTATIDGHNVFPFRVMTEDAYAALTNLETNVFYYTYDEEADTYTISVVVSPEGSGTVTGAGEYQSGASCTLTASPAGGYSFVNWTSQGSAPVTSNPYTFTVDGSHSWTANFVAGTVTIDGDIVVFSAGFASVVDDTVTINVSASYDAETQTLILNE